MRYLDGGTGTMLQAAGLPPGKDPLEWNLEKPEAILAVHKAYVEAGAKMVCANTFGANRLKYHGGMDLAAAITAGVKIAKEAGVKVALDVGPTGRLLKPAGDLDFEEAYEAFAEEVKIGAAAGADAVLIETLGDMYELKAAVLAAKENCRLPIFATVAIDETGKVLTGGSVEAVAALLEGMGVDAYGFNCGLGPDKMLPFVERLAKVATKPVIVKPNAGMPKIVDGKTVFGVGPEEFAKLTAELVRAGASIVGGCCGTTPEHIRAVRESCGGKRDGGVNHERNRTVVASGTGAVEIRPYEGKIIGERINPTGKKALKEAYLRGDTAYVLREAVNQVDAGAEILDVNCGVAGADEKALLTATIRAVQSVCNTPLQIDTSNGEALAAAMRIVNGKPLVNSVNGTEESMRTVLPVVKKHGGVAVVLCLDENGIPNDADGRVAIARKVIERGREYGLAKSDFVVDALTLAVSAEPEAAKVTLETVRRLTEEVGVNTILGVSNVSFGLPNRPALNAAMYQLAKKAGLSAAIYNPLATTECDDEGAYDVLLGKDKNCEKWVARANEGRAAAGVATGQRKGGNLKDAITRGLKDEAAAAAADEIASGKALMEIVQNGIVAALEETGKGFEARKVFLPQLLMSADAAGAAFEIVKKVMAAGSDGGREAARKRTVVLATVKGDIHDIGKNIVRALLENYGFDVIDLGRDVEPERIVEAAKRNAAGIVGLSALMTTTVGAMAETIRQLKASGCGCKTCVGGAVVTKEYAESIGADYYAKDAMQTVRYAEKVFG